MNKICRGCGSNQTINFCDLGTCPPSNEYLNAIDLVSSETYFPLNTFVCKDCYLVQTQDYSSADELFKDNYAYLSSTSRSWLKHAEDYAYMITNKLNLTRKSTITEIASNDGYLLKNFKKLGATIYGVEPTRLAAEISKQRGIDTKIEFFSEQYAKVLVEEFGHSDLIICNNVLAHVPDIADFIRGIEVLLSKDGTATIEFPHLLNLISHTQFDTIYHEHYSYLSLIAVKNLLDKTKLKIVDVEKIPTHGGSLRVYLEKPQRVKKTSSTVQKVLSEELNFGLDNIQTYEDFNQKVIELKIDILDFLITQKRQNKKIYGFGAAAKGNTLLNYCGVNKDLIYGVFDNAESKIGKYMPGSRIEIIDMKKSAQFDIDVAIIFPWNICDELKDHILSANPDCEIYVLIPELRKLA